MSLRRTPIKRTPMKCPRKRMTSKPSPRKVDAAKALAKAAPIAVKRAGGQCERCGLVTDLQLHHRLKRSAADRERPSNYLMLCLHCHTGGDESAHAHPRMAREHGWILHSHAEPSEEWLLSWRGWVRFSDDGTFERRPGEGEPSCPESA